MSTKVETFNHLPIGLEVPLNRQVAKAIHYGETFTINHELASTSEGNSVAQFLISTARLLRPILRDPNLSAHLDTAIGNGPEYNPYKRIDLIPGIVAKKIWRNNPNQKHPQLFIEEDGFIESGNFQMDRTVIVDPLDGSSSIGTGLKDQVSGTVVCDGQGNFLVGGIASLVDNTLMIVENNKPPITLNYNELRGTIDEIHIVPTPIHDPPRYQTLPRRLNTLSPDFFRKFGYPSLPTFGGYGVMMLVLGKQDFMIDPKGQPVNEAAIWYNVAQAYGCVVAYPDGSTINLPPLVQMSVHDRNMDSRIPVVIYRNLDIYNQLYSTIAPLAQPPEATLVYQN